MNIANDSKTDLPPLLNNPYAIPVGTSEARPVLATKAAKISCSSWQGRKICVRTHALASHGWLFNQVLLYVDEESFTSRQLRTLERFDFAFDHHGTKITGRFRQTALTLGFTLPFQVWIGDELIVEDTVLVKDAWKGLLAGAFVGFAAPILLLASLYAVYAFWF